LIVEEPEPEPEEEALVEPPPLLAVLLEPLFELPHAVTPSARAPVAASASH
jgi:hypothetical protein